jgi:hypothetical protein
MITHSTKRTRLAAVLINSSDAPVTMATTIKQLPN